MTFMLHISCRLYVCCIFLFCFVEDLNALEKVLVNEFHMRAEMLLYVVVNRCLNFTNSFF